MPDLAADVLRQLRVQDGRCMICLRPLDVRRRRGTRERSPDVPCADHCHQTNVKRGILCAMCNSGLGFFRDDPVVLERAAAYLQFWGGFSTGFPSYPQGQGSANDGEKHNI